MSAILAILPKCVDVPYVFRTFGKIVFVMAIGGLGGFIFAVSKLLEGGRTGTDAAPVWKAAAGVPRHTYLWWQAAIGSGGAFAAVFGMLTIGNATRAGSANDVTDLPVSIYLAALCVVGGFVGNRLLSQTAEDLLRQLKRTEKKVEENGKKMEETERKVEETTEANNRLTRELTDLQDQFRQSERAHRDIYKAREIADKIETFRDKPLPDSLRSDAIEQLNKLNAYKEKSVTERFFIIVFANLNFELGLHSEFAQHREQALNALENFIAARQKARIPEDEDDEVAWYNVACYNAVLAAQEPAQADKLKANAINALKKSLQIAQAGGENQLRGRISKSEDDTDLKSLRGTPEFDAIFALFRPAAKTDAKVESGNTVVPPTAS